MKITRVIFIVILVLFMLIACSFNQPLERSLSVGIKSMLPGDYLGEGSRGKVYHTILRLQVPSFGGDVFYHHISTESLRGPAAQSKVYLFEEGGLLMKSTVILESGPDVTDALANNQVEVLASIINALPEEQLLRFPDGCRFVWKEAVNGFMAEVSREQCSYQSPAFGGLVSPEMEYQLNACGLTIQEAIYREDGSPVFPPSSFDTKRENPIAEC